MHLITASVALLAAAIPQSTAQTLDRIQRDSVRSMAKQVAENVRKHYYDATYHGLDMDARFNAADERIRSATSLGQAFSAIAEALDGLNDSHTFFDPPARNLQRQSGYRWEMVGDACFITAVRPGSDAAKKIDPGDQVLSVERFKLTRTNFWKVGYLINNLYALPVVHMNVRRPDGTETQVEIAAKTVSGKRVLDFSQSSDVWRVIVDAENQDHLLRQQYVEHGDTAMTWKMPQFDLTEREVDNLISKARNKSALILDLRGNPGGYEATLQAVVGALIDHDVTIAARQGRKPDLKPVIAKTKGRAVFAGKLAVLIDARSASAAELLARVVQLEKRGIVVGDRTSGHVMESRYHPMSHGAATETFYGASITEADLIMADGKSLEHSGVIPDEVILPTAADIAAGRDPVLAKAAELLGLRIDPTAAGKLFPTEW